MSRVSLPLLWQEDKQRAPSARTGCGEKELWKGAGMAGRVGALTVWYTPAEKVGVGPRRRRGGRDGAGEAELREGLQKKLVLGARVQVGEPLARPGLEAPRPGRAERWHQGPCDRPVGAASSKAGGWSEIRLVRHEIYTGPGHGITQRANCLHADNNTQAGRRPGAAPRGPVPRPNPQTWHRLTLSPHLPPRLPSPRQRLPAKPAGSGGFPVRRSPPLSLPLSGCGNPKAFEARRPDPSAPLPTARRLSVAWGRGGGQVEVPEARTSVPSGHPPTHPAGGQGTAGHESPRLRVG